MKQVVQNFKTGELSVSEVPPPALKPGGVLVRTVRSLISAGTERGTVAVGQSSLVGKARQRPDLVRQVIDNVRREGVAATMQKVRTRLESLKPLHFLGNDLIAFHVLDPMELDFGFEDASSFEDLESGEQIPVVPESFRDEYRQLIRNHIESLKTKFSEVRIDYTLANTSEPLDRLLFSYLSARERLMRVR